MANKILDDAVKIVFGGYSKDFKIDKADMYDEKCAACSNNRLWHIISPESTHYFIRSGDARFNAQQEQIKRLTDTALVREMEGKTQRRESGEHCTESHVRAAYGVNQPMPSAYTSAHRAAWARELRRKVEASEVERRRHEPSVMCDPQNEP